MNNDIIIEQKVNKKISNRYLIIIVFLFGNFFNTGGKSISAIIGLISYISTFIIIFFYFIQMNKRISYKTFFLIWSFIMILLFLIFNKGISITRTIITLCQLIFIVGIIFIGKNFELNEIFIKKYKIINIIFVIILYICTLLRLSGISIMFKNLNALSEMSALFLILNMTIWYISNNEISINHTIIYLPLLLTSGGRNMLLCVVTFFIVFFMWNRVTKNLFSRILSFHIVVFIIYFITTKYPQWYYDSTMVSFNRWIRDITGKNFFSGRQVIWHRILEIMKGNEITGYGTGVTYSNLFSENLSAHNQYLQLYMQSGLIGLSILFMVLFYVWMILSKCDRSNELLYIKKRTSGSFFIAFMITNIFTVSMLQNTLYSSLIAWFIISFGLKKKSGSLEDI